MKCYFFIICLMLTIMHPSPLWADYSMPAPDKPADENAVGYDEHEAEQYVRKIDGWTTLTLAVLKGDRPLVEQCLKNGANINAKDNFHRSPLLLATEYNCGEMVRFLLDRGADVNTTGTYNRTPLLAALAQGNLKRMQDLLAHGAKVDIFYKGYAGKPRFNALHLAAGTGTPQMTKLLLDHGARLEAANEFGQTALHLAARAGRADNVRLLLERGADLKHRFTGILPQTTQGLFSNDPSYIATRATRYQGWTPLNDAVDHGHVAVARLLLEKGAPVNDPDGDGRTPLFYAVSRGRAEMVKLLLEHGAQVNVKTPQGETPLDLARRPGGSKAIETMLLNAGAVPGDARTSQTQARRQAPLRKALNTTKTIKFTKVVFTSAGFSTSTAHSMATPVKTLRYRIVADYTLNETLTNSVRKRSPGAAPTYDIQYYLLLQGSPQRIALDETQYRLYTFEPESVALKWLERGRLVDVTWNERLSGTGGGVEDCHLILLIAGHQVKLLLSDRQDLHHRNDGMSESLGSMRLEWGAKMQELIVTHYYQDRDWLTKPAMLCNDHRNDPDFDYPYSSTSSFQTIRRYRLAGDRLQYLGEKKYLLSVNGRPALDVAQVHSVELSELKRLNPSLKARIFCDRKVLLTDRVPEAR